MKTSKELIFIDSWLPWANTLIINKVKYYITDEVNDIIYKIYEDNGFPDLRWVNILGMPKGPYEIELFHSKIDYKEYDLITDIRYMGLDKLRKSRQRNVRFKIKMDRAKAKEWVKYVKEKRIEEQNNNVVVGGKTRRGVKNMVKIIEKLLH